MDPKQTNEYDLIIVGAGMVGASLALGLFRHGAKDLKVALIEAREPNISSESSFDDRNLALSLSTHRILSAFGLWSDLQAMVTPIERIHVSEQHRFAAVRMNADMLGLPALGYALKARDLGHVLIQHLGKISVLDFICPAKVIEVEHGSSSISVLVERDGKDERLKANLLVLADGSLSKTRDMLGFQMRQKDYSQGAIVSNVSTQRPHHFTAYERFNQEGPLALLPSGEERCGLVFTVGNKNLDRYMNMDDGEFIQAVEDRFGRRLGRFIRLGKRTSYPLRMLVSETPYKGRVLLLGNSAHSIHPNMAQGFNLGLRDVAGLIEVINEMSQQKKDIGSEECLQSYQSLRQDDQDRVIKLTDGLASTFYNDDLVKSALRNIGLLVTDLLPGIKKHVMYTAMGIKGRQPQLVRTV